MENQTCENCAYRVGGRCFCLSSPNYLTEIKDLFKPWCSEWEEYGYAQVCSNNDL